MAQLELKLDNIRQHGFPYACLLCGSDEHPELKKKVFRRGGAPAGCLLALILGPFGWICGLLWYVIRGNRSHQLDVPLCRCCTEAGSAIDNRGAAMAVLGLGCLFSPFYYNFNDTFLSLAWVAGIILLLVAAFDRAWLRNQFDITTLKVEADRVLLNLPNDDYPSLYQRHLDTAVLYGSVETTGTQAEDDSP